MAKLEVNCEHACKNTCASLNKALKTETATVRFYEDVLEECDSPEVNTFITGLVESRRKDILKIINKLNEIQARSQISNGIVDSFDSDNE